MGIVRKMRRGAALCLLPLSLAATVSPVAAQRIAIDLPAGPLGKAIDALAQQAGTSVVLAEPALWSRRVPAVRGRISAEEAVRRLARHARADARALGRGGWRLTIRRTPLSIPRPVRRTPPTAPAADIAPEVELVVMASKRATLSDAFAGSFEIIDAPPTGIEGGTSTLVTGSTIISSTYRGAGREKLFLRGVADSGFSGRLQSVTGLYLGEVRLTYSASDPDLQLYDMDSVEVLQGPQGTLYGSGSMAGIIRMNPAMPERGVASGSAGGGVSVVAHGSSGADADAVVNLPLGPDVALRVVGYARSEPAFIDRPGLGRDVNRTRIGGGRAMLRWWPGADWTVDAIAVAQTTRSHDTQSATIKAPELINLTGRAEPSGGDYVAGHMVVTGRLGDLRLVSATGVATQRFGERFTRFSLDVDVLRRHDLVTHETRLSRADDVGFGWVAGVAFADSRSRAILNYAVPGIVFSQSADAAVSDIALFGEGSVRIAPFLSIGAGARAVQVETVARRNLTYFTIGNSLSQRRRERWLLPTASILLRPTRALSLYLRYQQGRRAPLPPPDLPVAGATIPDERIDSVEAGLHWRPAGGPRIDASVQRGRWRAIQLDYLEGFFGTAIGTLGNAAIESANVAIDWTVAPGLTLDAAVTLNRSAILGLPSLRGLITRLPDVADVIARGGVRWTQPIGRDATLRVDGWARYEGRSEAALAVFALGTQGKYVRTGIAVEVERNATTFTIALDNLLNARGRRYLLTSTSTFGETAAPLRPRTVRIGIRRTF